MNDSAIAQAAKPAARPSASVPCVWVVASHRLLGNEHGKPQRYTVMDHAGTHRLAKLGLQPVCFPLVPPERLEAVLDMVDGVLLGGSATNVHPRLYGEEPIRPDLAFDELRDAVAQPLLRLAVARKVPVIGFCRGSHDFNVAMGGSMHQSLQQLSRGVTHWEDPEESLAAQYEERHAVTCVAGGELERITRAHRFQVSSLHSQGIHRLGEGLVAEAHADDGLVEAFRWHDPGQFAWGFQFHPEWGTNRHACYRRIMTEFALACRAHAQRRAGAA